MDNAIVASQCFHYVHREKKPDSSFCAYKLDLSKPYDYMDWGFLEQSIQSGLRSQVGIVDNDMCDHSEISSKI